MDTSKLITLGAVGIGLWLLYEWMVSQCETPSSGFFGSSTCVALLGSAPTTVSTTPVSTAPVTTTPVSTPPVPATTPTSATLASLLTQAAQTAGANPAQLSADQWSYYYQQIPGKPAISAATMENILISLGLTDATRGTIVTANQFASALTSNGLSGSKFPFVASWVPTGSIHGGLF